MHVIAPIDLSRYTHIVVLTGAGISVASGLPTYRGIGGVWESVDVEQNATSAAISRDPGKVWAFFSGARREIACAKPSAAHLALARAEHSLRPDQYFTLVTQNVDGLHQAAGSRNVVEFHGSLHRTRCTACDYRRFEQLDQIDDSCPRCPKCEAPLRPDVVLFDELISLDAERRTKAALRDCDLFVAIGTSGTVTPASTLVRAAAYVGAYTVYVNLEQMTINNPYFIHSHLGPAEELVPQLFAG